MQAINSFKAVLPPFLIFMIFNFALIIAGIISGNELAAGLAVLVFMFFVLLSPFLVLMFLSLHEYWNENR